MRPRRKSNPCSSKCKSDVESTQMRDKAIWYNLLLPLHESLDFPCSCRAVFPFLAFSQMSCTSHTPHHPLPSFLTFVIQHHLSSDPILSSNQPTDPRSRAPAAWLSRAATPSCAVCRTLLWSLNNGYQENRGHLAKGRGWVNAPTVALTDLI